MICVGTRKSEGMGAGAAAATKPLRAAIRSGVDGIPTADCYCIGRINRVQSLEGIAIIGLVVDTAELKRPGLTSVSSMQDGAQRAGSPTVLCVDETNFDGIRA